MYSYKGIFSCIGGFDVDVVGAFASLVIISRYSKYKAAMLMWNPMRMTGKLDQENVDMTVNSSQLG